MGFEGHTIFHFSKKTVSFGTFSPLAFAVPGITLLQWDIIQHYAEQLGRERSNVASVCEILSDNLLCVFFLLVAFLFTGLNNV